MVEINTEKWSTSMFSSLIYLLAMIIFQIFNTAYTNL